MEQGKTELIGDISGIVMGINKALIQIAEDYRKLCGYAKALNAENETLKEELKKLKV